MEPSQIHGHPYWHLGEEWHNVEADHYVMSVDLEWTQDLDKLYGVFLCGVVSGPYGRWVDTPSVGPNSRWGKQWCLQWVLVAHQVCESSAAHKA
jgi:hypothetical protein